MNLRQIIVSHFTKNKDRVFREVNGDPLRTLAAVRMEGELDTTLLYILIDALDANGTLSKTTVEEMLEKRLKDLEVSKAMLEVAKQIADSMPADQREKLYNDVVSDIMKEKPNGGLKGF